MRGFSKSAANRGKVRSKPERQTAARRKGEITDKLTGEIPGGFAGEIPYRLTGKIPGGLTVVSAADFSAKRWKLFPFFPCTAGFPGNFRNFPENPLFSFYPGQITFDNRA